MHEMRGAKLEIRWNTDVVSRFPLESRTGGRDSVYVHASSSSGIINGVVLIPSRLLEFAKLGLQWSSEELAAVVKQMRY